MSVACVHITAPTEVMLILPGSLSIRLVMIGLRLPPKKVSAAKSSVIVLHRCGASLQERLILRAY
jgi:hypothetical protein